MSFDVRIPADFSRVYLKGCSRTTFVLGPHLRNIAFFNSQFIYL